MQQPPNPYPQFQTPSPQSQQPPTPPKKRMSRTNKIVFSVIGAGVSIFILSIIIAKASTSAAPPVSNLNAPATANVNNLTATSIANNATVSAGLTAITSDQTQTAMTPTPVPTQVTPTPTLVPTVQQTRGLAATHGTPHLGGPISDFVGAYGQPDSHSNIQPGLNDLHFLPSTSAYSNADGLIVDTDPSNASLAANITVQAQDGNAQTSDVGWTVDDAKTRCMTFAPSDANFVKEFDYANNSGFDIVYTSVQLGSDFPASAFTDSQQNQVQAGTFDVSYLYASDGQHIDSCDMIIGEQQTTN